MARAGRKDRGLPSRVDGSGKARWYVRLYHEGRERRFGAFTNKTQARDFYEKAKQEQKEGRFFPERYQQGGYELVSECIARYRRHTSVKKSQKDQAYFAAWWGKRFADQRVNVITPAALEDARQALLADGVTPQRVNRYMTWLRACQCRGAGREAGEQSRSENEDVQGTERPDAVSVAQRRGLAAEGPR